MKYTIIVALMLVFAQDVSSQSKQDIEQEFEMALQSHLALAFDNMCVRLAPKLSVSVENFKDALILKKNPRQWDVKGHLKTKTRLCEIKGALTPIEKNLQIMCLDEKFQLTLIY